jgi:hypothetical protein
LASRASPAGPWRSPLCGPAPGPQTVESVAAWILCPWHKACDTRFRHKPARKKQGGSRARTALPRAAVPPPGGSRHSSSMSACIDCGLLSDARRKLRTHTARAAEYVQTGGRRRRMTRPPAGSPRPSPMRSGRREAPIDFKLPASSGRGSNLMQAALRHRPVTVIPSLQEDAALRIDCPAPRAPRRSGWQSSGRSPSWRGHAVAKPLIRRGRRGGRVAEGGGLLMRCPRFRAVPRRPV